jgi:hypothetical protein
MKTINKLAFLVAITVLWLPCGLLEAAQQLPEELDGFRSSADPMDFPIILRKEQVGFDVIIEDRGNEPDVAQAFDCLARPHAIRTLRTLGLSRTGFTRHANTLLTNAARLSTVRCA